MVRKENPIESPAPEADQTSALTLRSSSSSPSSRMISWMIRADGGVGPGAGVQAFLIFEMDLALVGRFLRRLDVLMRPPSCCWRSTAVSPEMVGT